MSVLQYCKTRPDVYRPGGGDEDLTVGTGSAGAMLTQVFLASSGRLGPNGVAAQDAQMLDRLDFEPVFFAPFVSSVMRVESDWIDYNGHLNMAYYNVLFDRAVDEVLELLGCGAEYVKSRRQSCFTAEVHVRYLRELHADDPVRVTFQLLGYDAKRLHFFEQLFHAADGWVSATSENMALHVDMAASKTAAFPPDVTAGLAKMKTAHAALPAPEAAGRRIAMPEKV
jgi:acyl-CoA thioester hydrolase